MILIPARASVRQPAGTAQSDSAERDATSGDPSATIARRPARSPRGAALVIVMLVLAVLLLAGTTFLTISSTESEIALNEKVSAQAFHLAEGAIHKALARLDASPSYTGETDTPLGGGSFTVTVTPAPLAAQTCPAGTAKSVVATASVPVRGGTARVQLRATADQIAYPYRWAAFAAVPSHVVEAPNQVVLGVDRTTTELWLQDLSRADSFDSTQGPYSSETNSSSGGHLGANGSIRLGSNVNVQGSVRAGSVLAMESGVVISGSQATALAPTATSPGEPFPAVTPPAPLTSSLDAPTATFTLTAGNLNVTDGTLSLPGAGSPYRFTSVTFGGGTALTTGDEPVTIYVTGPVTVGDNVTWGANPGTNLRIILKSDGANWLDTADFTAGDNFRLYGSIYGKNTNIQLGTQAQVFGSIVGRTTRLQGNSTVHFDQAMLDQAICHSGNYAIRRGSWVEVIP